MNAPDVIAELQSMGSAAHRVAMSNFGITPAQPLGISVPDLRSVAKRLGHDHELAAALWASGFHEARILASMVDDASLVTSEQMDEWVEGFDSWDVCDQVCGNLFDRTPFVIEKAQAWSEREEEFIKRAGFVIIAEAAVHDKQASDEMFIDFIPYLKRAMMDERNFVRKAVSWTFRQIGKRNPQLRAEVLRVCSPLTGVPNRTTRWIAKDVTNELSALG